MNFSTLHYVIVISEEKNITKAAERLYITQSALSQNLKNLEKELPFQIFDRTSTPLKPTISGNLFIEWAKQILHSENDMLHRLQDLSKSQNRVVRIGLSPQKSVHIFPSVLKRFYELQPNCKIILEEHPSDVLLNMLARNEIDILFDINHSEYAEYDFMPIAKEGILIATPKNLDIISKKAPAQTNYPLVELNEIMKHPFIALSEKQYLGRIVKKLYDIAGIIPNITLECRSADMALRMVEVGLGVTVIPQFAINEKPNDTIQYYNLVSPDINRTVGISYKKGTYLSEDMLLLAELLKRSLEKK